MKYVQINAFEIGPHNNFKICKMKIGNSN